jgi:glutathione S-transferase/GST-like protein
MIDVFAFATPNSVKEMALDYTLHSIDIRTGVRRIQSSAR